MDNKTNFDELKRYLPDYIERNLTKSKGHKMYICPICGSGQGPNGTGAFSYNHNDTGTLWQCFACNEYGDLFDLIGIVEHVAEYNKQTARALELYGSAPVYHAAVKDPEPQANYTNFFLEANKNLDQTNYHRGISRETLDRFKIGFVERWRHPNTKPGTPTSPRLIIPTSPASYLARDTRTDLTDAQKEYSKMKVGSVHLFNPDALKTATRPVYIVEGELDALSIIDAGGEAIALGSTSNYRKLLELIDKIKPGHPLLLALDKDEAGQRAEGELAKGLTTLGIAFEQYNPSGEHKDPNAALLADREAFTEAVAKPDPKAEYLKTSTSNYLQAFIDGIATSVDTPEIPTGFPTLDYALDGGLYEGLYIIGAVTSLGKTTFVMQIADQIAQSGTDVLIFSLEMARTELMAKSISRLTYQLAVTRKMDTREAKTARGITASKRYKHYSPTERNLIKDAIAEYSGYAENIYISEGIGDIGAAQIRATVKKHLTFTGRTPVIVVDYLQILAPAEVRATDKQNTDKAILELKRISRDFKTPVIGVSSLNRANYSNPVTLEAFKESGAVEYGADLLIGLQFKGQGTKEFKVNEAKGKEPREIELIILKNRNHRAGLKVELEYYPMFNCYREDLRLDYATHKKNKSITDALESGEL